MSFLSTTYLRLMRFASGNVRNRSIGAQARRGQTLSDPQADATVARKLPELRATTEVALSDLIDEVLEFVVHHKDHRNYISKAAIVQKAVKRNAARLPLLSFGAPLPLTEISGFDRVVPSCPGVQHKALVRAEGLEPSRTVKPCGFSSHFGFRRPARRVRGLDYPFTVPLRV